MSIGQDPLARFAENVRARRRDLGMTQEIASERATMGISYWSRLERGKVDPGVRMVARVASALRTTPDKLLANPARPRRTAPRRGSHGKLIRPRPTRHRNRT